MFALGDESESKGCGMTGGSEQELALLGFSKVQVGGKNGILLTSEQNV